MIDIVKIAYENPFTTYVFLLLLSLFIPNIRISSSKEKTTNLRDRIRQDLKQEDK